MLFLPSLSLVLLPLASALPYLETTASRARSSLESRKMLSQAQIQSQFNFLPWEFRNICLDCKRNGTDAQYSCRTKFDWYDPNSVAENNVTSGTCSSSSWEWDGTAVTSGGKAAYPAESTICYAQSTLNYLQFRFIAFNTASNFTVEVDHRYLDSKNFSAPYDHPTTFTRPNFNLTVTKKTSLAISSFSSGVQYAKVQGVSD